MFGESDSESPRAGSPWDTFLEVSTSPPSSDFALHKHVAYDIPSLIPEAQEGNVEYKLRLLNPSTERFARLVTQLKWRLLEGGGQAYYELGVSDSGQLVGLSRAHLEQSLQTLEEMAEEIGASVIVVKEIEVPTALLDLTSLRQNNQLDGAMRMSRKQFDYSPEPLTEGESTAIDGDMETGLSAIESANEFDDFGANVEAGQNSGILCDSACSSRTRLSPPSPHLRSHPDRPSAQSSPALLPFDEGTEADVEADPEPLSIDLEIASVYKPRPSRKRTTVMSCRTKSHSNALDGLTHMPSTNPKQSWMKDSTVSYKPKKEKRLQLCSNPVTKATKKRDSRDERRAKAKAKAERDSRKDDSATMKHSNPYDASLSNGRECGILPESVGIVAISLSEPTDIKHEMSILIPSLETLHVSFDKEPSLALPPSVPLPTLIDNIESTDSEKSNAPVRRLIVEALVVRKMSLEEAFLDFGVFSLRP